MRQGKNKSNLSFDRRRKWKVVVTLEITALLYFLKIACLCFEEKNIYSACWFTYKYSILCLWFWTHICKFPLISHSFHAISYLASAILTLEMCVSWCNICYHYVNIFFLCIATETMNFFRDTTETFWEEKGLLWKFVCTYCIDAISETISILYFKDIWPIGGPALY